MCLFLLEYKMTHLYKKHISKFSIYKEVKTFLRTQLCVLWMFREKWFQNVYRFEMLTREACHSHVTRNRLDLQILLHAAIIGVSSLESVHWSQFRLPWFRNITNKYMQHKNKRWTIEWPLHCHQDVITWDNLLMSANAAKFTIDHGYR